MFRSDNVTIRAGVGLVCILTIMLAKIGGISGTVLKKHEGGVFGQDVTHQSTEVLRIIYHGST